MTLELTCLIVQFLYAMWLLLLTKIGSEIIIYSDILWRELIAGLGIVFMLVLCNDVSKVLMIAYMNRPEVPWVMPIPCITNFLNNL